MIVNSVLAFLSMTMKKLCLKNLTLINNSIISCITRGDGKAWKEGPDCVHKFSNKNGVARVSRRKKLQNFSLQNLSCFFLMKCLSKHPNSTKNPPL